MATLYVTADYRRFVPEGDPEAAFGVSASDIDRLHLREAYEEFTKPKAIKKATNKMAPKPSNK